MNINILDGTFNKTDTLDLLTKFIDVKIKFQEQKIKSSHNEEDLKMRENRIKSLQKDLYNAREYLQKQNDSITLTSIINIT